jgi:UDP-2,3-diacylglucosamine pyrophosphatase LpxH
MRGGYEYLRDISNEGSDVLVLAGDVVEVVDLKKTSKYRTDVMNYLGSLNDRYKKIIFVAGNHEHWGNSFYHTNQNLRSRFFELGLTNFEVLDNQTCEVDDVIFFGATMWTTMRDNNPIVSMDCVAFMNDYKEIHVPIAMNGMYSKYYYGDKADLMPEHTIAECRHTKREIKKFIDLKTDKKKVLVTHHAPCMVSLSKKHEPDNVQDAYYEEISNELFGSDIKMAIHGHIHDPVKYMIGNCLVVSNPRGNYGYEANATKFRFEQAEV